MLLMTRDHHSGLGSDSHALMSQMRDAPRFVNRPSTFFTTNSIIRQFSQNQKPPAPGARIVYCDGAWDMFHAGHISTLKKAKSMGDYLIVGVFNDAVVNEHRGSNMPILNMQERVLSVLGCRYVDDVLIDAPWVITEEMIKSLNISVVVHGSTADPHIPGGIPPYEIPRRLGLVVDVSSEFNLSVQNIIDRIKSNEDTYRKKFEKKIKAEEEYYQKRYHGDEQPPQPEAKKNQ